jgi:NAD+ synthase (glutamine-hydrolysing)
MTTAPHGFLRVAAATPRVAVADPARNLAHLLESVEAAAAEGVQVLVLPELCVTGYTSGDLFFGVSTLVGGAQRTLSELLRATAGRSMVIALGAPVLADGRLFNCAVLMQGGALLGAVPKTYLPGYKEFYEERWFSSSREAVADTVRLCGRTVPFGTDLLFRLEDEPAVTLAAEVCEDLWMPVPPSSHHALAGATVLLNVSSSDEQVAKADWRRDLVRVQSGRCLAAYVYANTGVHESSTDLVFGGQDLVAESGNLIAESERFRRDATLVVADVDVERLVVERVRQTSFADGAHELPGAYRHVPLRPIPSPRPHRLRRRVDPHPFVPADPATLGDRCREIFAIQAAGLARRLEHTRQRKATLGLSGGLDSTLALLVVARAFDLLELPHDGILPVTMPGFGTTDRTLQNARRLAAALGCALKEIDIRPACRQHIADIGLDPGDQQSATFQNVQARERTQILMDYANLEGALQVGTGDLSELALGWSTYNGDHMSMYGVNAGVPKTLVKKLVRWVAENESTAEARAVLLDILDTPISPELVPAGKEGAIVQKTEEIIGPYELHDFFLHAFVRLGAGPAKITFLAGHAFEGRYDRATVLRWLRVFVTRFFSQQFKRSALPDGPKVGSVALSPRGDWRMPSDASPGTWLAELDALESEPPS